MPNSGSCDGVGPALDGLEASRAVELVRRLPDRARDAKDSPALQGASRDFAALLYTMLVQQMQKTAREEAAEDEDEETAMKDSVDGFVGMFLPQAVAGQAGDPLTDYIHGHLSNRNGGPPDDKA